MDIHFIHTPLSAVIQQWSQSSPSTELCARHSMHHHHTMSLEGTRQEGGPLPSCTPD